MFLNSKIRDARIEKKMTQIQLANELTKRGRQTKNTAIANWESGLNNPDVDTLQLICQILEKDGNYFFDSPINNYDDNVLLASYKGKGIDLNGFSEEAIKDIEEYIKFKKAQEKNKNRSN